MEQYKPFIKDLIKFYYEDLGNSTGGYFHIVLDDGNVGDESVWFCQEEAEKNNDSFGVFLGQVLSMFTEDERRKMYEEDWWGMRPNDNCHDSYHQLIIDKIIELLKTKPEHFSARWFDDKSLDKSVRSQNKEILIIIDSGQICQPIEPQMSKEQKELVKQLLIPIVKRDSDYLVKQFVHNNL